MRVFAFRPYALGGTEKERGMPGKTVGGLGLDFNYLVNPTIKLDFTVHPDFAQIESDNLVVNLTRFSVSLPEKRQFFLDPQAGRQRLLRPQPIRRNAESPPAPQQDSRDD